MQRRRADGQNRSTKDSTWTRRKISCAAFTRTKLRRQWCMGAILQSYHNTCGILTTTNNLSTNFRTVSFVLTCYSNAYYIAVVHETGTALSLLFAGYITESCGVLHMEQTSECRAAPMPWLCTRHARNIRALYKARHIIKCIQVVRCMLDRWVVQSES